MDVAIVSLLKEVLGDYVIGGFPLEISKFPFSLSKLRLNEKRIQQVMGKELSTLFDVKFGTVGSVSVNQNPSGVDIHVTDLVLSLAFTGSCEPKHQESAPPQQQQQQQQQQKTPPQQPPSRRPTARAAATSPPRSPSPRDASARLVARQAPRAAERAGQDRATAAAAAAALPTAAATTPPEVAVTATKSLDVWASQQDFPSSGGGGGRLQQQQHQPAQPRYCSDHATSDRRVKVQPRWLECPRCKKHLQTNYEAFAVCPLCSNRDHVCMLCGRQTDVDLNVTRYDPEPLDNAPDRLPDRHSQPRSRCLSPGPMSPMLDARRGRDAAPTPPAAGARMAAVPLLSFSPPTAPAPPPPPARSLGGPSAERGRLNGNAQSQPDSYGPDPPAPSIPARYCTLHERSDQRHKGQLMWKSCKGCRSQLETSYLQFEYCPDCSQRRNCCVVCGAGASAVRWASVPRLGACSPSPSLRGLLSQTPPTAAQQASYQWSAPPLTITAAPDLTTLPSTRGPASRNISSKEVEGPLTNQALPPFPPFNELAPPRTQLSSGFNPFDSQVCDEESHEVLATFARRLGYAPSAARDSSPLFSGRASQENLCATRFPIADDDPSSFLQTTHRAALGGANSSNNNNSSSNNNSNNNSNTSNSNSTTNAGGNRWRAIGAFAECDNTNNNNSSSINNNSNNNSSSNHYHNSTTEGQSRLSNLCSHMSIGNALNSQTSHKSSSSNNIKTTISNNNNHSSNNNNNSSHSDSQNKRATVSCAAHRGAAPSPRLIQREEAPRATVMREQRPRAQQPHHHHHRPPPPPPPPPPMGPRASAPTVPPRSELPKKHFRSCPSGRDADDDGAEAAAAAAADVNVRGRALGAQQQQQQQQQQTLQHYPSTPAESDPLNETMPGLTCGLDEGVLGMLNGIRLQAWGSQSGKEAQAAASNVASLAAWRSQTSTHQPPGRSPPLATRAAGA